MKAVCWYGKEDVRVENVPDPTIQDARDAILRITSTAICGSDLHLYGGFIPEMHKGDVLGHEFMGEVVETGPESTLKQGDRVVVPFDISCGKCWYCQRTSVFPVPKQQSGCRKACETVWLSRSGSLRVFAPVRRLSRWASPIRSRSVFGYRTDQNP